MPVFGYCRVSTDEQVSGCQVQQDMILDTCARLNLGEPTINGAEHLGIYRYESST